MRLMRGILAAVLTGFLTICQASEITGTGAIVSNSRTVPAFTSIRVSGPYKVNITVGNTQTLTIKSNANLIPHIKTQVNNNILVIENDSNMDLLPSGTQTIEITTPTLQQVTLQGPIALDVKNIHTDSFSLDVAGATQSTLAGNTKVLTIQAKGQSSIDSTKLIANKVSIDATGATKISVNAKNTLNIKMAGAGQVKYIGSPTVKQQVYGAASIVKFQ